jgi:hypothetical protein
MNTSQHPVLFLILRYKALCPRCENIKNSVREILKVKLGQLVVIVCYKKAGKFSAKEDFAPDPFRKDDE